MFKIKLAAIALMVISFVAYLHQGWDNVMPGTYLGTGEDISGLSISELDSKIEDVASASKITLSLPDRTDEVRIVALGMSPDMDDIHNQLFNFNFLTKLSRLTLRPFFANSKHIVPLRFTAATPVVYLPVGTATKSRLIFEQKTGQFSFSPPLYDYLLSTNDILSKLSDDPSLSDIISVPVRKVAHTTDNLVDLNYRIKRAAKDGIKVRIKDGTGYSDITLSSGDLRSMLAFSQRGDDLVLDLDEKRFADIIDARLSPEQKPDFQLATAYPNAVDLLNKKFTSETSSSVVLGIDDGPTTDGKLANSYLEIDISQQKMYFFRNGIVYKHYRVSTGVDYPTPVGQFHILNKSPHAFSGIYNVWMDYWMAFHYASDVGASLGIHQIAYSLDEKGNPLYRLGNYIGQPGTGGCIALSKEDAQEVYSLATVGMLVNIVE